LSLKLDFTFTGFI